MRILHLVKKHDLSYFIEGQPDNDLWILALALRDCTAEDIKEILQNPSFNCTTGNSFGVVAEEDPNKITVFDIFGDLNDPISITLERDVLIKLLDQFIKLKKQKPDEIIIEQHNDGRFSVRGIFYKDNVKA